MDGAMILGWSCLLVEKMNCIRVEFAFCQGGESHVKNPVDSHGSAEKIGHDLSSVE
jgi:hypothetical protein